jgi:endogenous inhibitor of DNA gyrase (YacG/DUF329 family)
MGTRTRIKVTKAPDYTPPPPEKDRPECPYCGKRLRPRLEINFNANSSGVTCISHGWKGKYNSYGAFCSLRCGMRFGNAAYKGGYRMFD